MRVTVLGCGSSAGVPVIGCQCAVCLSGNPKNNRTRVSLLVEIDNKNILFDTSPDLRQQALRHDIRRIDAVLFTHDHADHTHGIDDLRSFNYLSKDAIPIYSNAETLAALKQYVPYVFLPKPDNLWYRPCVTPHTLPDGTVQRFNVEGIQAIVYEQQHGKVKTLGYRIENFAYSTDTDSLSDAAFEALAGVDTWIVDCLRYSESYSHSHVARTLEWVARVKPRLAVLTHMSHELDYDKLSKELPAGVVPGYDGMVIEL